MDVCLHVYAGDHEWLGDLHDPGLVRKVREEGEEEEEGEHDDDDLGRPSELMRNDDDEDEDEEDEEEEDDGRQWAPPSTLDRYMCD